MASSLKGDQRHGVVETIELGDSSTSHAAKTTALDDVEGAHPRNVKVLESEGDIHVPSDTKATLQDVNDMERMGKKQRLIVRSSS